jgi:hypothetical protein
MALFLVFSSVASTVFAQTTTQGAASITPAASGAKASGLSQNVGPSFAGFGIEPSNLFSFTGGIYANDVSMQFMQNLADYSGAPPHIRIGGNTADYMIYDTSFDTFWVRTDKTADGQGAIASNSLIFGPK